VDFWQERNQKVSLDLLATPTAVGEHSQQGTSSKGNSCLLQDPASWKRSLCLMNADAQHDKGNGWSDKFAKLQLMDNMRRPTVILL